MAMSPAEVLWPQMLFTPKPTCGSPTLASDRRARSRRGPHSKALESFYPASSPLVASTPLLPNDALDAATACLDFDEGACLFASLTPGPTPLTPAAPAVGSSAAAAAAASSETSLPAFKPVPSSAVLSKQPSALDLSAILNFESSQSSFIADEGNSDNAAFVADLCDSIDPSDRPQSTLSRTSSMNNAIQLAGYWMENPFEVEQSLHEEGGGDNADSTSLFAHPTLTKAHSGLSMPFRVPSFRKASSVLSTPPSSPFMDAPALEDLAMGIVVTSPSKSPRSSAPSTHRTPLVADIPFAVGPTIPPALPSLASLLSLTESEMEVPIGATREELAAPIAVGPMEPVSAVPPNASPYTPRRSSASKGTAAASPPGKRKAPSDEAEVEAQPSTPSKRRRSLPGAMMTPAPSSPLTLPLSADAISSANVDIPFYMNGKSRMYTCPHPGCTLEAKRRFNVVTHLKTHIKDREKPHTLRRVRAGIHSPVRTCKASNAQGALNLR
ncbi:hypothetical protein DFJ73DRAFT_883474, partial [Zopfochytrium polystomum]